MTVFIQYLVNGLSMGSVYAIIALGYTMVYGIAKMLNFAHGDVIMVGAYVSFCATSYLGLPGWASVVLSCVVCTVLGVLIEGLAYKPLRQAGPLAVLITAIGVSYFLQNAAQLLWGATPKNFTSLVTFQVPEFLAKFNVSAVSLVTIVACLVIMAGLMFFTGKTKMGKAMRAVSEDKAAAQLMGINVNRTISMTFAIGSALAAIAGVLLCSSYPTLMPTTGSMPGIKAFTAAVFGGSAWVATSAYFIGVAAIVISGIMLKKTKMFAGDPAPFVMELPAYHFPSGRNVFHSVWERGWSFIKRAGTVILLSSIVIWFAKTYGWAPAADVQLEAQQTYQTELADYNAKAEAGTLEEDEEEPQLAPEMDRAAGSWGAVADMDNSILGKIGNPVSVVFKPLGFGNMPSTVATVMGLVAKEEVVGVLGVLYGADDAADVVDDEDMTEEEKAEALSPIATAFNESSNGHGRLAAYAFMIFNLLCAPCFAAIGAMKREFNNAKWTLAAVGYQCAFAYTIALIVYQLGLLFSGAGFTVATAIAILLLAGLVYLVVRKNPYNDNHLTQKVSA